MMHTMSVHRIALSMGIGCLIACSTTQPTSRSRRIPANFHDRAMALLPLVETAATKYDVPLSLILGVIEVESSFNPDAESPVGARGLMQLMPRTATDIAVKLNLSTYDLDDPQFNIEAGTYYLSYLLNRFRGDTRYALAAYNSGPARVAQWFRDGDDLPSYSERYVSAVLSARHRYATSSKMIAARIEEQLLDVDRDGLRTLLRQELYGTRPDEAILLVEK